MFYTSRHPLARVLFLLFLWSGDLPGQTQSLTIERYSVNHGLSNPSINSVYQTRDGFLWIATKDGLNRFDGREFRVFKKTGDSGKSLSENYVMTLQEDDEGRLWVGTWGGGLYRMDAETGEFYPADLAGTGDEYIQFLLNAGDGFLWAGTRDSGLLKIDPASGKGVFFTSGMKRDLPGACLNITGLVKGPGNSLLLASLGGGIYQFDQATGRFKPLNSGLENRFVNDVSVAGPNRFWVSTELGLYLLDFKNETSRKVIFTHPQSKILNTTSIRQVLQDRSGNLWIGTISWQGLFKTRPEIPDQAGVICLEYELSDPRSLSSNQIRWLFEDRHQNLWIGTEDGLNKLPKVKPFLQYRTRSGKTGTLNGRVVSGIQETESGFLWVGYRGSGFDRVNRQTGKTTHFSGNGSPGQSLSNEDVTTLLADSEGKLLIGTIGGGVNELTPETGKIRHWIPPDYSGNVNNSRWIQKMVETRSGQLLVGTNDALWVLDRKTGRFTLCRDYFGIRETGLPAVYSVNELFVDSRDRIWVGTWQDGLFCVDPSLKKITRYPPGNESADRLSSGKISAIRESVSGGIWVGTHSGGLNFLNPATGKITRYSTQNGLPNDVVFSVLENRQDDVWISTLNGLVRLTPSTGKTRVYTENDGLVSTQFNWHGGYKTRDGRFCFGGINGFVLFHPDSISVNRLPPAVALTSFKVFDQEASLPRSLPATRKITLKYFQNFFSVDFIALDMAPKEKHDYRYQLDGIDPGWVDPGNRTTAFYTDIRPGVYRFSVVAANADKFWSPPKTLEIEILAAWYSSWWFNSLLALTVGLILFSIYRFRLNQLMKVERIRMDIATDLHDEIGSNLSSISLDSQVLLQNSDLAGENRRILTDISRTAKETIDSMRDIIWFINPGHEQGNDLILKMKTTAAAQLTGINWTFETDPGPGLDHLSLDVRKNCYLILKEALTNAARHSGAATVTIRVQPAADGLTLTIRDDGSGFDPGKPVDGNGIGNMKLRAGKIGATLDIFSTRGTGTELRLTYPEKK